MSEKIKIWTPLCNIGGMYLLESISETNGNDNFIYKKCGQEHIKIHVICESSVASFKYTNETYRPKDLMCSDEEIKAIRPWCFYSVKNSLYLKAVSENSGGLANILNFKHYCIISEDEVIDIITNDEPIIELYVDGKLTESSRSNAPANISAEHE